MNTITVVDADTSESEEDYYDDYYLDQLAQKVEDLRVASKSISNIPIIPTCKEITQSSANTIKCLKPNNIYGRYISVEEYLEIHFNLLREDFINPLREAIKELLKTKSPTKKVPNITVDENVQFLRIHYVKDQLGFVVQYDKNFKSSKTFMHGALLCFTKDNFKTLFFGKVIDSNSQLLHNKQVIVHFESPETFYAKQKYTMVVYNVYFEPYFQVLTVLQGMSANKFPLSKYIVYANAVVSRPTYAQYYYQLDYQTKYQNLLNDSQYRAFIDALRHELAIIQGPPGTGKTYVASKIVEALLGNKITWYGVKAPILIVCCKNRALDHFMETLLDVTDNMVRYGGQSKSKKLERFTLREKRYEYFKKKRGGRSQEFFTSRHLVDESSKKIKRLTAILNKIERCEEMVNILKFPATVLGEFSNRIRTESALWEWLLFEWKSFLQPNTLVNQPIKNELHEESEDNESTSDELEYESDDSSDVDSDIENALNLQDIKKNKQKWSYIQFRLSKLKSVGTPSQSVITNRNPFTLTADERWQLYFYYLNTYAAHLHTEIQQCGRENVGNHKTFQILLHEQNIEVLRHADIIGMTSTAAARMHSTLEKLGCKIVIIEEAADVLEAHIIATLTSHCQHLILIGDHQQLRPRGADYSIEKDKNLGISLFERLINNDIPYNALQVQHRMRPEIANLICPSIYPDLKNHPSVCKYPPVRGVEKSLFFFDHKQPESNYGCSSKCNTYEAEFLLALARHLIHNEYKPEDITILVAYLGQWETIKKLRGADLKDVRVMVLDSFQGEESEIVLLSLVRNNNRGSIGFLSNTNRICVALSRAKQGLYIMGNMNLLCSNSTIWPKIKDALISNNAFGTSCKLYCSRYPDIEQKVSNLSQLNHIVYNRHNCRTLLPCGCMCKYQCHSVDNKCECSKRSHAKIEVPIMQYTHSHVHKWPVRKRKKNILDLVSIVFEWAIQKLYNFF